jgi:hypothetical protein
MIAFNCPTCTKAFMEPNRSAGEHKQCPGCGQELVVPPPPARRGRLPLLWVGVLAILVLAAGLWWFPTTGPRAVQQRFAAALQAASPRWQGIVWERCDPEGGQLKVQVSYTADRATYTLVLSRVVESHYTSVRVDPQASPWLALAHYYDGKLEGFDYRGWDPAEKQELQECADELDTALTQALGPGRI